MKLPVLKSRIQLLFWMLLLAGCQVSSPPVGHTLPPVKASSPIYKAKVKLLNAWLVRGSTVPYTVLVSCGNSPYHISICSERRTHYTATGTMLKLTSPIQGKSLGYFDTTHFLAKKVPIGTDVCLLYNEKSGIITPQKVITQKDPAYQNCF